MQPATMNKCRCWRTLHLSNLLIAVLFSVALETLSFAAPLLKVPQTRIHRPSDINAKSFLLGSLSTITVTNTNDHGGGSLRQAIANAAPGSTIDFDANVFATPQTITLTLGQLVIDKNLTIQGPGADRLSLRGSFYPSVNHSQLFYVNNGVTAALSGLTVNSYGGGIHNLGTLTISDIAITGSAEGGEGGIYNGGAMTASNSTITGNAIWCNECAGGVYNAGTLTIMNSTISGNSAMDLGDYGTSGFSIVGGILNTGTVTIINSSVTNNEAIWNSTIINSFVGGIANFGTATLENTIVAGNSFVSFPDDTSSSDISGTIETASHNLIGDTNSSGGIQNGLNGNIVGVNPLLGPLRDNGGPTMTLALLPGSPAINSGDNGLAVDPNNQPLQYDQRGTGFSRIVNGTVDIGAFEAKIDPTPTPIPTAPFDFDGDGKTDISIYRPQASSEWWVLKSSDRSAMGLSFGTTGDLIVPADYTGDGKTDVAVWRPSNGAWYILRSEDSTFYGYPFGAPGDIPAPADFDGDGKADAAVYRPSEGAWYILGSHDGFSGTLFGTAEDRPVPGDYDGDGKTDIAVFRPSDGTWYVLGSGAGFFGLQFGMGTDLAVPADYDGDGKTDMALFRPSEGMWYILGSTRGFYGYPFGLGTDLPVPGDYDGDGKTDAAVFRPSNGAWYILGSTSGFSGTLFGLGTDQPVENAFVR